MTSGIYLVALLGPADSFWPSLTGVLHWHRHAGPLLRLCIAHPGDPAHPGGGAAAILERLSRTACPGLRVERRELDPAPDALRRLLDAWAKDAPDTPRVIQLASDPSRFTWGLDSIAHTTGTRIVVRQTDGSWIDLVPLPSAGETAAEPTPLPTFRREELDELPVADLIKAQAGDTATSALLSATPAQPLPVAPLTEAAIAASWQWKQAFRSSGLDPGSDSENALFQRYLGALLLDFGLRNVVLGARKTRSATPAQPAPDPVLWINYAGRLLVLDARLDNPESNPGSDPTSATLEADLLKANRDRRDLGALWPEWILVRPCHALTPVEKHLADAYGLRVLDETDCRDLPNRIAAILLQPLPASAVEIERRLRSHLAETGCSRVFGPESALLQQQRAAAPDPVIVHADSLLEQIQRARGQNWLLWNHQDRSYLRVPAEGRTSAAGDWRAMLAAFVGFDAAQVQSRQTQRVVLIDFPDSPETRKRVADWLRPFLNASLTFDTARARFAAEARVTAEAASSGRSAPRPGSGPAPATAHPAAAAPSPAPSRPAPRPAPPAPSSPAKAPAPRGPTPPPAPRRMQKVSLEDLDRALDSAFTPPPDSTAGR